jgi:hypothetical protein
VYIPTPFWLRTERAGSDSRGGLGTPYRRACGSWKLALAVDGEPGWDAASPAVPPWNYALVHAYGVPRMREDATFIAGVVEELTRRYEGQREPAWSTEAVPGESYGKLLLTGDSQDVTVIVRPAVTF